MHPNDKDPQNRPNPPIKVEDLPVEDGKDADIKGGPAYIKLGDIKGEVAPPRP